MRHGPVHTAHNVRTRVHVVTAIGVVLVAVLAWVVGTAMTGTADDSTGRTVTVLEDGYDADDRGRRVMSQEDFPCNEDEVLGYAPEFGPDHVGCMNVEDIDR